MDLLGPAPVQSIDGYKYYVQFLDDHSRFTWIYLLRQKSDTISTFRQFILLIKNQFGTTVKTL